jgi:chemotaxis regulatin CheY-phosphate phosphatase CheZ
MMTDGLITIPARAREEIGELAFYLEQTLRHLREVHDHVRGTSTTMPGVLHELRDIVAMTETATVKVLEETEALVDEGRVAATLLAGAHGDSDAGNADAVRTALTQVEQLVQRSNDRAMAIMAALEFQDLTSQKVQRAFGVLEEALGRLGKIQALLEVGGTPAPAETSPVPAGVAGQSAQDLADEILQGFSR